MSRHVTVDEFPFDDAAGHQEGIEAIALGQRNNPPAVHGEVIDAGALLHGTQDTAGINQDAIGARAERDRAVDGSRTTGGQRQAVVALKIGEPGGAGAAVADERIVTGTGAESARGMRGLGREVLQ
ncbi:hypothetical protein [Pseudomonas sp. 34 E 7]|nr:hypothetical protein [Pseudomonas sp. 34 E 7]